MEPWLLATLFAAFAQNLRSVLQKQSRTVLSVAGATSARFVFAAPLAIVYLALILSASGGRTPAPNLAFLGYVLAGGTSQVVATFLLVALFDRRSYAIAVIYSKSEVLFTVAFSVILLAEAVPFVALVGIVLSLLGVLGLHHGAPIEVSTGHQLRTTLFGLGSGAGFALSAVTYRGASLSLGLESAWPAAAYTLAWTTSLQAIILALILVRAEPGQLMQVLRHWRTTGWIGVAGVAASAGWFTAFALQNAAIVRAVGQVEVLFTFVASLVVFKERQGPRELAGALLLILGVLVLVSSRST